MLSLQRSSSPTNTQNKSQRKDFLEENMDYLLLQRFIVIMSDCGTGLRSVDLPKMPVA